MKKNKHSKIRNTGILFELLSYQITSDMMNGDESNAIDIVKEYFKKGTNLNKELILYQTLLKEKTNNELRADRLIDEVVKMHNSINRSILSKEKYNLIKEIKRHYNLEIFVKNHINNYRQYASIYKLLENHNFTFNPAEIVKSRDTIVEFITTKITDRNASTEEQVINEYSKYSEDIRQLAYKILLEKFNDKYAGLGDREKKLLREYINNVSNTTRVKDYIDSELIKSKKIISKNIKSIADQTVRIKLTEVNNIIDTITKKKKFDEATLLTVLHVYKLQDEIVNIVE